LALKPLLGLVHPFDVVSPSRSMLTAAATAVFAVALLAVPVAGREHRHRALAEYTAGNDTDSYDAGLQSVLAGTAEHDTDSYDARIADLVAALADAASTDAAGHHHLYFHSIDASVALLKRCGEVDAAPQMPPSLFEPANIFALAAYVEAAIRLYQVPLWGATPLQLGRCASSGYTDHGGGVQGVPWFGRSDALMGEVCAEHCNCDFTGLLDEYDRCADVPDNPQAFEWCSLCGPTSVSGRALQLL
jgi:hypothetical protein